MASVMRGNSIAKDVQLLIGVLGWLSRAMATIAPKKVLPASPMKILAGDQFQYKKPRRAVARSQSRGW